MELARNPRSLIFLRANQLHGERVELRVALRELLLEPSIPS
jgi:hypothetical protein